MTNKTTSILCKNCFCPIEQVGTIKKKWWEHSSFGHSVDCMNKARLAERAKCIAQLKDHQAHCDNCANDHIEMAIIILETNEAIECQPTMR